MPQGKILIVDDDKAVNKSLTSILGREGYEVSSAYNYEEGRRAAIDENFDIIFLDVFLPHGYDGLMLLKELIDKKVNSTIVMISAHGNIETAVEATKLGAYDFLEKPIALDKLLITAENIIKLRRLQHENEKLKEEIDKSRDDFIGQSKQMQELFRKIETVAPTRAKVLITGENGTGKEMVARAIHEKSQRAKGPFIKVNCAAIPRELIESELFGHEKGAFTGATHTREGKFELANHGTIFLDEIADMSLDTQAKVLRVLQDQQFERVGGTRTIEVDVRIITATNKDLLSLVEKNLFREDLYYRLNVLPFHIPPLRERKEDIPVLVEYFFEKFAKEYGKPKKTVTPGAMELFMAHPWPGNVRELKNMVERIVIMVPDETLTYEMLEEIFLQARIPFSSKKHNWELLSEEDVDSLDEIMANGSFRDSIQNFEKLLIEKRLSANSWNITKTAAELGIERSHLHKKMKLLGIKRLEEYEEV